MGAVAYLTLAERKVIAAMQLRKRTECCRSVWFAAADCRWPEAADQGNHYSGRCEPQWSFILAPMLTFILSTDRLGGDPVR
jgi:hypothetical protein